MSSPLVLAIDCSTEHLAVALVDGTGLVLDRRAPQVGRDHAARLPLEFESLLETTGRQRRDIARIHVGVGPGSYTGTRVAIAAAMGLARALGVPVAGVSSFVGLAAGTLEPGATAAVTLDARRGNVYVQACRHDGPAVFATRADETGVGAEQGTAAPAGATPVADAGRAPGIVTLSEALKLPAGEVSGRFGGLPVVMARAPDAAAMAVSSQLLDVDAVYL